jgi:hypothetical protein
MTIGCELSRWALIDRSARVLQHPGWVPNTVREPMKKSNPETQEGDDRSLIEEIYQINYISHGEGAATCQTCGSPLHEGDSVVAYVFRPAGELLFQTGYVVCGDDEHELPMEYTLGVRELLVEGRVGWCSDGATQSSWPVLLVPEVVGVSAAATKSLRRVPDGGITGSNVASGGEERESAKSSVEVSVGEARRRSDGPDGDVVRGLFWGEQR